MCVKDLNAVDERLAKPQILLLWQFVHNVQSGKNLKLYVVVDAWQLNLMRIMMMTVVIMPHSPALAVSDCQ